MVEGRTLELAGDGGVAGSKGATWKGENGDALERKDHVAGRSPELSKTATISPQLQRKSRKRACSENRMVEYFKTTRR